MSSDVVKAMSTIMQGMGYAFTLNNLPLTYAEVFSPTGVLPAIARRADQLCSLCLGYGIGATFEEDKEAKLGTKVKFDEVTPDVLRYLCMTDVLCEIARGAHTMNAIALDELTYD